MKKPQERIMFTNYCSTERENDCREFLFSEYGNEKGWETKNSIPDSEIYDELNFQEEIEWDDFKNDAESAERYIDLAFDKRKQPIAEKVKVYPK